MKFLNFLRTWRRGESASDAQAPAADRAAGESRDSYTGTLVKDEHFVPTLGLDLEKYIERNDLTAIHHLIRYRWAIAVLSKLEPGGPLLDLGCGAGYGAYLLANALPRVQVLGVDYDEQAIQTAAATYRRSNLSFRAADPLLWSRPPRVSLDR